MKALVLLCFCIALSLCISLSPSNVPEATYPGLFPLIVNEKKMFFINIQIIIFIFLEWAHSHWVWLASSQANQSSEIDLVNGYLERDVPVGAVDIDSEWTTGINNFIWDTNKYPDAKGMIDYFHSIGVNVICWVTSVIDTDSSNYDYGLQNHYYVNTSRFGGHVGKVNWWHGKGSFIDYTNPNAVAWWHSQMDQVIDIGLDGWKCDGTDPYTFELYPMEGYGGHITEHQYADSYYGDFFNYTRSKNPNVKFSLFVTTL